MKDTEQLIPQEPQWPQGKGHEKAVTNVLKQGKLPSAYAAHITQVQLEPSRKSAEPVRKFVVGNKPYKSKGAALKGLQRQDPLPRRNRAKKPAALAPPVTTATDSTPKVPLAAAAATTTTTTTTGEAQQTALLPFDEAASHQRAVTERQPQNSQSSKRQRQEQQQHKEDTSDPIRVPEAAGQVSDEEQQWQQASRLSVSMTSSISSQLSQPPDSDSDCSSRPPRDLMSRPRKPNLIWQELCAEGEPPEWDAVTRAALDAADAATIEAGAAVADERRRIKAEKAIADVLSRIKAAKAAGLAHAAEQH